MRLLSSIRRLLLPVSVLLLLFAVGVGVIVIGWKINSDTNNNNIILVQTELLCGVKNMTAEQCDLAKHLLINNNNGTRSGLSAPEATEIARTIRMFINNNNNNNQ